MVREFFRAESNPEMGLGCVAHNLMHYYGQERFCQNYCPKRKKVSHAPADLLILPARLPGLEPAAYGLEMHRPTGKQEAYNSEGNGEVEEFSIPDKLLKQVTWFKHYTGSFSQAKLKDQQCIDLKIHHSFRVLGHAIRIAESLGLDSVLTNLTHLAALFHDLGRFPQYARFRTFHDGDSTNHAKLSIDVLRESDVLGDLPPEERRLVLAAIFLHNRPSIPGRVSPQLNKMARIVRDADKLDIIAVMISYFSSAQTTKDAITLDLNLILQPTRRRSFSISNPGALESMRTWSG